MPANKGLTTDKAKAAVVAAVAAGATIETALAGVGRVRKTYESWRASDKVFAAEIDRVRHIRQAAKTRGVDPAGTLLSFVEWRKRYLNRETYPHMQTWVDLLEGRPLSGLHPSMDFEPANPNRIIINVPPFHAKSQTLTVDWLTYQICLNPNIRILIVSKKQEQAKKFLFQIKQRLTSNLYAELQAAYGPEGGFRTTDGPWSANMIYVGGRDSDEKDPTVEAIGLGGQIYGSRADLILLDDCVVGSNAAEYEKQIDWLESEVENRVFDGKIILVGTRLKSMDLYAALRDGSRYLSGRSPWTYLRMPMVLEFAEDPDEWVTLWPKSHIPMDQNDAKPLEDGMYAAWDGRRCAKVRDSKPPLVWQLVYQQQQVADDAVFDPLCVQGSVDKRRKVGPLVAGAFGHPRNGMQGMYTIVSIDPAASGESFVLVYAVERTTQKRYVLNCWTRENATPQWYLDKLADITGTFHPDEIVVESNGYANWFITDERLTKFAQAHGIRVTPHKTYHNKSDPEFGVMSLVPLFGTTRRTHDGAGKAVHNDDNLISLPDPDKGEGVKSLIEQLIAWQPGVRGGKLKQDGPMALWFAELRARVVLGVAGNGKVSHFVENRYLSKSDRRQRVIVPLSDYGFASNG